MMMPHRLCRLLAVLAACAICGLSAAGAGRTSQARQLAFYDIVPYAPGREAETARDIRAVRERTGLDTFLYSVSLDPRGRPAFDSVEKAVASYRRLKEALGDAPVRLGFLLQSILGHWARVDREIEPWERSVDIDGAVKRFCVLDPRFQDYIRRTAAALAAEKPCLILGDDDIRAFSGKLECFCPRHTAEFNARTSQALTPEQFRAAVKSCTDGDMTSATYARLRDELTMTVARLIREGIDSVDPAIPAGVCMPGAEQLLAGPRARVLAGRGNPVTLRLANGMYHEIRRGDFVWNALQTQAFIDFYRPSVDVILDEADTYPHTLYSRSGRTFGAKMAMSVFNGIDGAKLWFVGMHKGSERVPEAYDRVFAVNGSLFEELARTLKGSRPAGLRIPAFQKTGTLLTGGPDFFARSAWPDTILGVYGIPFYADFSRAPGEPVLLGGAESVCRMKDDELAELFRGRVFVDGPAALELAARGRSAEIGCHPVLDGRPFNCEVVCATGARPPVPRSGRVLALTELAPGAGVSSELRFAPPGGGDPDFVAAATVCATNAAGGVVLTASFDGSYNYTAQNLRRKEWLVGALRALAPEFPAVCDNPEPNMTLVRRGTDGRMYAYTLSVSYDDLEEIRYRTARPMSEAEILGGDGVWRPADAMCANGVWTLRKRLGCMEFVVVRW